VLFYTKGKLLIYCIYCNLEPIPKIDRIISIAKLENMPCCNCHKNKNKTAITNISDKLWDTISPILPDEKPNNTIGRPVIPYRKVLDGIVYVLRTKGCQ